MRLTHARVATTARRSAMPAVPPTADPAPDHLSLLARFEAAWQTASPPSLDRSLPTLSPGAADQHGLLEEFIKIDLEYRGRRAAPAPPGGELRTPPLPGVA